MEENGTFIALITINLGGVGLLTTYILANYFFYTDRINDLRITIESEFGSLKTKLSEYKIFDHMKSEESDHGEDYISNLHRKHAELSRSLIVEKPSESEIIEMELEFINLLETGSIFLKFININSIEKLPLTTNKDIKNLKKEFESIILNFENFQYYFNIITKDFKKDYDNFIRKSTEPDTVYKKEFNDMRTIINRTLQETRAKLIPEFEALVEKTNKFNFLYDSQDSKINFQHIYYCIQLSALFGILLPLICINTLPYNTSLFDSSYDFSNLAAALLSFISLLPYAIILSKLRSFIKVK
ncbi:hypothetical protein OA92_10090 [Marinomonas sp. SBI22]|uniref:hypothetical protein n=1 Tax=unclassified Marinomonas TaxID=196814 RepID=UPI0007AEED53|nr:MULTISPECIES: hypothetical protein [unclassified Marinomonas]KZM43098.1 hypothetical protein OA92_10090 [Marinomonas sp. SBI22]KZM44669.1 hypothetical protein OA91_09515 [Marinomonas sp. SBI8L]